MSLIHQLRTSISLPIEYHQYLLTTSQQFDMLIRGAVLPTAQVASPVAPIAGPSRTVSVITPTHPIRAVRNEQSFLDWGQSLELVTLQPVPGRPAVWSTSTHGASEYIRLGERYYTILPGGSEQAGAVIVPNNHAYTTFAQFENILQYDLFSQPRLVEYSTSLSRWLINLVPLQRPIVRYIERCFPTFSSTSARQIAETLFVTTNPQGLSNRGYLQLLNTLRHWRASANGAPLTLGDPLLLMARRALEPNSNTWPLHARSTRFDMLELNSYQAPPLAQQNDRASAALMGHLLRNSGYQVFEMGSRDHLLFRRPGQPTVYWLSLRRTPYSNLALRNYREPVPQRSSFQNLPAAEREIALEAYNTENLVPLIGVLKITRRPSILNTLIFRP